MSANPYDAYRDNEVLMADPLHLVRLLYEGALDAIAEARQWLRAEDPFSRSNAITRAQGILVELQASLDFERGGEIAKNLGELYAYVKSKLFEANLQQRDEPLAESSKLLGNLLEGWRTISSFATVTP